MLRQTSYNGPSRANRQVRGAGIPGRWDVARLDTLIGPTAAVKILTDAGWQDSDVKQRSLAEACMAGSHDVRTGRGNYSWAYFCYHLFFRSTNVVPNPGGSHARRKAVFWTGPLRYAGRAGAAPILPANRDRSCALARRSGVGCFGNRLLGGCLRCHLGDGAAGSRRVWNGDLRRSMATLLRR